jgi:hypothetical protein
MMMKELAKTSLAALLVVLALPLITGRAQERSKELCRLPPSTKVDAFDNLSRRAQMVRLERIIPVMEAHSDSHAFIVTYAGRHSSLAEAQRRADLAKRQLLEKHEWIRSSVMNSRVNTLVCGYREVASTELWVTPVGAAPPVCAPTVTGSQTAPKRAARRPR